MSTNPVRKHISNLMKQGRSDNDPIGDQLERELDNMDPSQGPLPIEEKAENADKIIKSRQRALANVGFVAAMHPDAAASLIRTAYDIYDTETPPTGVHADETFACANNFLQSLFRYYSDVDEKKKK